MEACGGGVVVCGGGVVVCGGGVVECGGVWRCVCVCVCLLQWIDGSVWHSEIRRSFEPIRFSTHHILLNSSVTT